MNPSALERALQDYVTESDAAALLQITRQALHKKADHVKRRMSGIPSPCGWLFHRDTLLQDPRCARAPDAGQS
jgi:hypothetical protein